MNGSTVLDMTMGSRLQQALDAREKTATDLIAGAGVSKGTVYNVLNDTTKPDKIWAETVRKFCTYLHISRDWLLWGRGSMEPTADDGESDWPGVRGYAQAVGLGSGPEAQEYAETHKLKFRAESLSRKRLIASNLAVMYGEGDSMLPRLHPGDAILFDQKDTRPRDGKLYVIQVHGIAGREYQVKRCMILDDEVYFAADNPAGDHQWIKPRKKDGRKAHVDIIGRVRWIGSWED